MYPHVPTGRENPKRTPHRREEACPIIGDPSSFHPPRVPTGRETPAQGRSNAKAPGHTIIYPRVPTGRENPKRTPHRREEACPIAAKRSARLSRPANGAWTFQHRRRGLSHHRRRGLSHYPAHPEDVRLVSTPPASQRGVRPQPRDEATRRPRDHTIIDPRVPTGRENPRATERSVSLPETNRAHEVICPTPASPHTSAPPATGWPGNGECRGDPPGQSAVGCRNRA